MKCKHCGLGIEGTCGVVGWRHLNGLFWCESGVGRDEIGDTYADPVEGEGQRCGCGGFLVGECEVCEVGLCAECDCGQFSDVLICADRAGCEGRLRLGCDGKGRG